MVGRNEPRLAKERLTQGLALFSLLAMGAWVLVGPSGLLAWSENNRLLAERQKELAQLKVEREDLKNRVALLDPRQVDPDMAGQLLRANLNVVHPDEVVLIIK
ncbi:MULTISPECIES: septum formation initiator family protein [unclassified Novosphingobium]|jgi:cell division protein FtsB|uniref:FtsB family cell division protein n=1 Tax=unclassified Novosphingobium TaxID=2644732 RepID=UPI0025E02F29|nr:MULTISPECIES: septum formation initiator family protein [unclassified Novosphingobium]HQV02677.1 septum formation initiator family protein [Novosphingobium sp.]